MKIVLIVLAVVLALCCCGGGVGAYLFFDGATKPAREATSAFLTELESGDLTAAYDRLCDSTKIRLDRPAFAQAIDQRRPVSHDLHWGGSYSNDNGVETAVITADMTYAGGGKDARAFRMLKEDGAWKPCGNPY